MGNCFGRCLSSGRNSLRHSTDEQEADELVQEEKVEEDNFIFKIIKFKKKKNRPQFIEKFWEQKETNYKRLNPQTNPVECSEIQLQCLDANNLLRSSPATTTALDIPLATLTTMKYKNQNYQQLLSSAAQNNHHYHQPHHNNYHNHHHNPYHHENCYKNQIFNTDGNVVGFNNSCCFNNTTTTTTHNNINSSRASSSLDLEWEHEYGGNTANIERQLLTTIDNDDDEMKNLTQSWYFVSSSDDEFLASRLKKNHHHSNQQLLNICDDDDDEYAIDIVNCKDKNLIRCSTTTTATTIATTTPTTINNILENQNNFYIKSLNKSTNSITSTPSSIDIINNYSNLQLLQFNNKHSQHQEQQQQQAIFSRTPSRQSWSHISTPESLEWDIDEEQQKQLRVEDDNLDHETLELLHEIELLKNKVLNETGSGLIDDKFEMNWKDNNS